MNAKGKHTAWAGEVDIDYETKKVIRLKDQSGHYRTFDKDNPGLITKVALKAFQELGYDTSETIPVLTAIEGGKDLAYKNYKPPTHGNLEDSNWQVPSKQYRDHL